MNEGKKGIANKNSQKADTRSYVKLSRKTRITRITELNLSVQMDINSVKKGEESELFLAVALRALQRVIRQDAVVDPL